MSATRWGLQQGMIGKRQHTLQPSLNSLGPNRYLTQHHFIQMIGLALFVHIVAGVIANQFHVERVRDIPVRALTFNVGDAERGLVMAPRTAMRPPVAPPPVPEALSKQIAKPAVTKPGAAAKPSAANAPASAAIAAQPQRFIRENKTPTPAAPNQTPAFQNPAAAQAKTDASVQAAQTVRARYEQVISGWIQKHKIYPRAANGAKGRAVVHFEIDRSGNVRSYGIEESSGNTALDNAALDMVRRANPMPAVPVDYPAGSLIGFSIGLKFDPAQ